MNDRIRGLLAVALSFGVLLFWQWVIVPKYYPAPPVEKTVAGQTHAPVQAPQPQTAPAQEPQEMPRPSGEKGVLENAFVRITFDSAGGVIEDWRLKKFSRNGDKEGENVSLADGISDTLEIDLFDSNVPLPSPLPFKISIQEERTIEFRWESGGIAVQKRFHLDTDSYLLEMELEVTNRSGTTFAFLPKVVWKKLPFEESPQRGALFFKSPPDRWHPLFYRDGKMEAVSREEELPWNMETGKVGWAGHESHYFLGGVIPVGSQGQSVEHRFSRLGEAYAFDLRLVLQPAQVLPKELWLQKFKVYGGPKEYGLLKAVGSGMEKAVGYGWTSVVAIPLLYLLQFFYKVAHNYGLAIILLTILVKILLNPINRKSMESMKGMSQLQPRLKELQKKYGNDKQRLNTEMMQLFKAHKVNPMGGCLPMLLQFPIYIALYKVLWGSVELYHAPFFWIYKDLSAPDPYFIIPVLLGIAMFVQTKMTPTPSADPAQQKIMMIMPLMFAGIMIFLPLGLGLYILVNTVMTVVQQKMYQKGIRLRDLVRGRAVFSAK